MKSLILLCSVAVAGPFGPTWPSPMEYPKGAVKYKSDGWTQTIYILTDNAGRRDRIDYAPISGLAIKWHQSGGMDGIKGFHSDKYRLLPSPAVYRIDDIQVLNSFGYYQANRGIVRSYPSGTRFDDVLSYKGKVFEHRMREKVDGVWKSRTLFKDEKARPPGYTGLTVSCASCHDEAGTGGYAVGLVPGGDTVLSDPLDWDTADRK